MSISRLDVGEVAARLHREQEGGRCPVHPALDRLAGGQPVEGGVHLHRVEACRVVREPATRRHPRRIEDAPPVRIVPARAADADGLQGHAGKWLATGMAFIAPPY